MKKLTIQFFIDRVCCHRIFGTRCSCTKANQFKFKRQGNNQFDDPTLEH